jgi:hypothetical protein
MKTMKEPKPVDITSMPEVLRLAQEVARSGVPVMLMADGEELAALTPACKPKRRPGRAKPVTKDDPLFRLIGSGRSRTSGGVSEQKHGALVRAKRRGKPTSKNDPLWRIVGMADADAPKDLVVDVSSNVDKYLADADDDPQ